MKILLILAHPYFEKLSKIHRALIDSLKTIDQVDTHLLHEHYIKNDCLLPIDVKKEQDLLMAYDRIILQYPIYWYMPPSLLKHWIDEVLLHNFAYGKLGKKLHNKELLIVSSFGQKERTFSSEYINRFPVEYFMLPMFQTFYICEMRILNPFYIYNTDNITPNELSKIQKSYLEYITHPAIGSLNLVF